MLRDEAGIATALHSIEYPIEVKGDQSCVYHFLKSNVIVLEQHDYKRTEIEETIVGLHVLREQKLGIVRLTIRSR